MTTTVAMLQNAAETRNVNVRDPESRQTESQTKTHIDGVVCDASVCADGPSGRACRLFGLTQGQPDVHGLMVRRIYVVTDDYAIYAAEDVTGPAKVTTLTFALSHDDETARRLRRNVAPLATDLARIGDAVLAVKPRDAACPKFALHRHRAFSMMARAMALAFDGAPEEAKGVLAFVRRGAESMRDSANRMRYVAAITAAFLMIGLIGLACRYLEWPPFAAPSSEMGAARMVDVMLLGAVGAWFSVALEIQKVRLRHAISRSEMIYAGLVRVPVGVIAAAMVVLLAQAGWLPFAEDGVMGASAAYLLGFLAGFSEMLVPNALKQKAASAPAPVSEPV
jgi:hypothetical protein